MPNNRRIGFITVKSNSNEVTIDTGNDDKDFELANKWNWQQTKIDADTICNQTDNKTGLSTTIYFYFIWGQNREFSSIGCTETEPLHWSL